MAVGSVGSVGSLDRPETGSFGQGRQALQVSSLEVLNSAGIGRPVASCLDPIDFASLKRASKGSKLEICDHAEALAAVRRDGLMLEHVSEELRGDPDVVIAALCQNINAKRWSNLPAVDLQDLINSITAVKKDEHALRHASKALRDREEVLAAQEGRKCCKIS